MDKRLEAPDRVWIREDRYGINLDGAYGAKPKGVDCVEYVRADLAQAAPEPAPGEGSPSHPSPRCAKCELSAWDWMDGKRICHYCRTPFPASGPSQDSGLFGGHADDPEAKLVHLDLPAPSQDSQEVRAAIVDVILTETTAHRSDSEDAADKILALLSQSPKGAAGADLRDAAQSLVTALYGRDSKIGGSLPWQEIEHLQDILEGEPSAPKTGLRGAPRLCVGCGHDERVPVRDEAHPNALACCPDRDYRTPDAAARYARDLVPDARALVEGWILDFLRTEPAPGDVGSAGGDKA